MRTLFTLEPKTSKGKSLFLLTYAHSYSASRVSFDLPRKVGRRKVDSARMSGRSKKVEPAGRVYFPLPDLSTKIESRRLLAE